MIGKEIFEKLKARYKTGEYFKILFCPYKEDMFDSMQTVWESASRDTKTITDIMPIPYFTLVNVLPNETKMEFPQYQLNFPEILNDGWDVIVIHYPYDTKNNITRPMLTSGMLKFFTKHLVHINYAVIGNRDVDEVDGSFPAYKNCDLIVCEQEKHAKQLTKILRERQIDTECVGWGSPKYDMLERGGVLPPAWEKKIICKHVILLQTSLIPFMTHDNKLEQIEEIIDKYFNDDSVCLWWRPHPLLEATIKAHRPSKLEGYKRLLKKVEESRHILDLTSDMPRAIAETDELISDRSSLVILYMHTGKPITLMEEEDYELYGLHHNN